MVPRGGVPAGRARRRTAARMRAFSTASSGTPRWCSCASVIESRLSSDPAHNTTQYAYEELFSSLEVVPRRAIAKTARFAYGENYTCLPMRHHTETGRFGKTAEYQWKVGDRWCTLSARTVDPPKRPQEGGLEQFITEAGFDGDACTLYGRELATVLQRSPQCAFVADGSPVIVFMGNKVQ